LFLQKYIYIVIKQTKISVLTLLLLQKGDFDIKI